MLAFDGPARTAVFSFCCLIIGSVGVVDTYLVHEHSDSILDMEKNPVCLALIALDPHSLLLFTHVKLFCLGLVISTLVALFRFWNRGSLIVALGVAGFQLWLLGYLYLFSDFPHLWRVYID